MEEEASVEEKEKVNIGDVEVATDSAVDIIVDEILEDEEIEVKVISGNLEKSPIEEKTKEIPVVIITDPISVGDNERVFVNEEVSVKIID